MNVWETWWPGREMTREHLRREVKMDVDHGVWYNKHRDGGLSCTETGVGLTHESAVVHHEAK